MSDIVNTKTNEPNEAVKPDEPDEAITAPTPVPTPILTPADYVKKVFNKTGVKVAENDPLIPLLMEIDALSEKKDLILSKLDEVTTHLNNIQEMQERISVKLSATSAMLSTFMTLITFITVMMLTSVAVALFFVLNGV